MAAITLDDFLMPISVSLGRTGVPQYVPPIDVKALDPNRVHVSSHAELVDRFVLEAETVRAQVYRCKEADVVKTVQAIVAEGATGPVVVADDERLRALGIEDALAGQPHATEVRRWDASKGAEACRAMCVDAEYGITVAEMGVAETGSIVQACSANIGRTISLLPQAHIAIIRADTIVPSMLQALECCQEQAGNDPAALPSQICFITGPSNTADIELVRVEGAHGPIAVHYIVTEG